MILDDSVRPSFASARIHSRRTRCLPPKNRRTSARWTGAKLARGTAKRRAARCAKTRPGREHVGMTPVECGPYTIVVARRQARRLHR